MKSQELRKSFISFFTQKSHKHVPGSPIVPVGDPTLLFTTAGMVQFKSLWDGTAEIQYSRAVTIQKCLRLSDLENVGTTPRHDTFFEMLGNFSFGDYFKKEAIDYAWDFLTNVLKIPTEKLWITVYHDDKEAKEIWQYEQKIPEERIIPLGAEDNFWGPAGESGPCGPCSEIIYDMGKEMGCGSDSCNPGCDCARWLEIWNLVFPQFEKKTNGESISLKNKGIDTGMGLERLAMIMQNKPNIFETDLFFPVMEEAARQSGCTYGDNYETDKALKIISDHVRALTFCIAENITPSNEGRGYVLRRLVRRASKYGRDLGFKKPFLYSLVNTVIDIMHETYPELLEKSELVKQILASEEERFLKTLDQGMNLIQEVIAHQNSKNKKVIPGKVVFTLYDTFGFPVEMTEEILEQNGLRYNHEEFLQCREKAKKIARQSWQGDTGNQDIIKLYREVFETHGKTRFTGYEKYKTSSRILALMYDGKRINSFDKKGETLEIVLDSTPFYAESGGQVADTGELFLENGKVVIEKVEKTPDDLFIHKGKIVEGTISENSQVKAHIDETRRQEIMKHHTATHLLQAALRRVLGEHIGQTGSYVSEDHFRFDFTHFQAVSHRELELITEEVNNYIQLNLPVQVDMLTLEEARKIGALAFFGEKYGDTVRVITVPGISCELCGGTHISNTGAIGSFQIISESSIASGVRRIEAVVGKNSVYEMLKKNNIIRELENLLKTEPDKLLQAVKDLERERHHLQKQNTDLRQRELLYQADELLEKGTKKNDVVLVIKQWKETHMGTLMPLADHIRQKARTPAAILFINEEKGKVQLLVALTQDLVKQYHAGYIVKELAGLVGGGGGGKPDCAQAGGKNPENISQVMKRFVQFWE